MARQPTPCASTSSECAVTIVPAIALFQLVAFYGQNFGVTRWFPGGNGIARHPNFSRINLDYARRTGLKLLRVGLLDDGRVVFDRGGQVVGYDATFRKDVGTLLNLAQQACIRVEFTLFDFQIAGRGKDVDGVWVRGRPGVITDLALRTDFRTKFLRPFLMEFGNHPALFGFDVINEPEWIIERTEGGGWDDYNDLEIKAERPVPRAAINALITECANDIRQLALGKPVTVGVSARFLPLVNNLALLSYLAPHHYHWMGDLRGYLPLLMGRTWSLEEYPTKYPPNATPGSIPAQNRCVPIPIDLGPESDQAFLILFGTGFRFSSSLSAVSVGIGSMDSEVLFAGAQGVFVGLDQINVRLSRSLIGRGEVDVTLMVDGKMANTVRIAIK